MSNAPCLVPRLAIRHLPARRATAWLAGLSLAIAGCGGGGSSTDDATAAASGDLQAAYAAGPITGFGSVIVNGVRFDDSSARVSDDDGTARRSDELRLGMLAEVLSSRITTDASGSRGVASSIRFGSEIVGPIASVASDGASLVVLGMTVLLNAATLYDDRLVGGLAALRAGTVIEVHGLLDAATGTYTATRIEPKPNAPAYKLRGLVTAIDKTARTFRLGSGTQTISYDAVRSSVSATLDNGQLVKVRLQTTAVGGVLVASQVVNGNARLENHAEAELEGTVTASSFATDRKFSVNGVAVDATNAAFPSGTAGIVPGARVEVKGSAVDGVVIATRVQIESERERQDRGFELHGAISALDITAKTFVVRGITVSFAAASVEVRKGTLTGLANGVRVEVKGLRSGATGAQLTATRISFED